MRARLFLIPLLMSSAACSQADDYGDKVGVKAPAAATAQADGGGTARAVAKDGQAKAVAVENDFYKFDYSYPAAAGAVPKLAAELDRRAKASQDETERMARKDSESAKESDYPFRKHSLQTDWKVVADLPGWLSLNSETYAFQGGAHGNYGYDSLVWDRKAGTLRDPLDFFRSPADLENAVATRFCAALDAEREKRRGQPIDPSAGDSFNQCPGLDEVTVLLGSSNGETFDRIGLVAGPYVAGPYAEGTYELTLRVDTPVLDAVKPEYRKAFALGPRKTPH